MSGSSSLSGERGRKASKSRKGTAEIVSAFFSELGHALIPGRRASYCPAGGFYNLDSDRMSDLHPEAPELPVTAFGWTPTTDRLTPEFFAVNDAEARR